ncbi:MAG: 16S rRNA processing protein RimM [Parasporobacterium sp.]|nr:16S rRNA processing protein RimM [Parasporobacterium sp.]
MEQYLRIGVITTTHGLKGEVKVYPTTDSPRRFKEVKRVFLEGPKGRTETTIEGVRFFKNLAIVKFACFDSVEAANGTSGMDVLIDRADGQPLAEGEYYIADLLGCTVVSDEGETVGVLKDVLQTGANDVYVVTPAKEIKTAKGKVLTEILIPVIPQCILNVDIEKSIVTVHLMAGLID